jgi:hypothetical protein
MVGVTLTAGADRLSLNALHPSSSHLSSSSSANTTGPDVEHRQAILGEALRHDL